MDFKTLYNRIPLVIRSFLIKAAVIFVVWQLLYHFVLWPARIPDRFLTNVTCFSTCKLLTLFYDHVAPIYAYSNDYLNSIISINGVKVIGIADACNGLDIFVLYISFLFCFPGSWKRRALFIAGGVPYIFIVNTIRCAIMTWMKLRHRDWVDISHHYIFTTVVYLLVFYAWVLYTKKGVKHGA